MSNLLLKKGFSEKKNEKKMFTNKLNQSIVLGWKGKDRESLFKFLIDSKVSVARTQSKM